MTTESEPGELSEERQLHQEGMAMVRDALSTMPPEKLEGTEYGIREAQDGTPWFYAMKGARWVGEELPGEAVKNVSVLTWTNLEPPS